jgi:hypothetical protein
MSAAAVDLCAANGGRGARFLSSTPRVVFVLVLLMSVLGFEITDAIADASVGSSRAVVVSSEVKAPVFHHLVPPLPKAVSGTGQVVPPKPVTSRLTARPPARTAPPTTTATVQQVATRAPLSATPVAPAAAAVSGTFGCGAALAYLGAHAAPGFRFECPGYALGHQAMTCIDVAGVCPGSHLIVIDVPCSAAYMNEASNSWVLEGLRQAPIDPYGYCH